MNQWWAWCWNTYLSPPMSEYGWKALGDKPMFTRAHFGYGLLVGRVFVGVTVSRKTGVLVS